MRTRMMNYSLLNVACERLEKSAAEELVRNVIVAFRELEQKGTSNYHERRKVAKRMIYYRIDNFDLRVYNGHPMNLAHELSVAWGRSSWPNWQRP